MSVVIKGGEKLEARLKEIAQGLSKPVNLRVGFLEGSTGTDGGSLPLRAALNNFGHGKTPARPFFSNMVKEKSPGWPAALEKNLKATGFDGERSMEMMGDGIKGQLQDSIRETFDPPLSPITVMLRGMKRNNPGLKVTGATVGQAAARVRAGKTNYGASTKPLVDTGDMLAGADFEVNT